ncbi:bacteriohopanetetrol glucosamine biosynthesis glycosyltransferase HpnI [Terriglobus saanensis]|uniref:Hopanoid biosynthesis associated glycosyl transferase protein HpnI n=1 Tax=Terriglobus saanensis (strain ATCC BAA-1853 / DSM 23119 / SP1PR4) TaxID=401053 RepID=E8V4I0_TERSS|nr:bacteriohopanetetrol glucosamine biosynthesis glycosyltransferase HpnI [Terriglobus saanensis]ADV84804.1 hopanoid biosynthesis associated glycosyl transferase protein HpnI [Terriglobus saanensis SP1PR4]
MTPSTEIAPDLAAHIAIAVSIFCALMTLAGLVYMVLTLRAGRSFTHHWRAHPLTALATAPTVTLLKPLKGVDARMYAGLRSHCLQQYAGRYEILFGVSSLEDPAVAEIDRLRAEFPELAIRVLECPERLGTSGKVSNLAQMLPHALGEILLVNDSDILVSPHYLARVVAGFTPRGKKKVGMVTTPYLGASAKGHGLLSRIEALGIATEFFPSVLTARMLEGGLRFGLGSTLAMPRTVLEEIGGFAPLTEHLADDYELGARIYRAGYAIELVPEIVETIVPRYTLRGFCDHQLRWMRSVRDSRRAGYLGVAVTYVIAWALATCVASGFELWSFTLLSVALLARVAVALSIGVGILRDEQVLRDIWLLPLRDCIGLLLWAWSYAGDTVVWRGERFHLRRGILHRS